MDASVDAAYDHPFIDLDEHWGECCDTVDGGVGGGYPPPFDGGCGTGIIRCFDKYCGMRESTDGVEGLDCCGAHFKQPLSQSVELEPFCPPFPAGASTDLSDAGLELGTHWGECCYTGHGGTGKACPPIDIYGSCPGDAGCIQCAPAEYCGAGPGLAPQKGCCGDCFLATIGESPIDPTCPPAPWDGGP